MNSFISVIVLLSATLAGFDCQIHYVPAQILIPTINGTHLVTNQSVSNNNYVPLFYNNSRPYPPTFLFNNSGPSYQSPYYYNYSYPWAANNSRPSYNNNSVSYNGTKDGHLILGTIQTFDRLLFNQEYFKPRRWYTYREKTVEYPRDLPAGYSRHETINAIRIYNKFYDGNTARATVESGGLGRQYVKIQLRSKWGNGFKYLVQIFGH
ncbi:hypothetical protein NQ317_001778 [Molorchus minor]|uniref:Uncharacterized protein n=1 Tax=Molorchus minor TaxID=1323400 RepID=A0ABQ9IWG6_9CUCU|nr:hypothetical protein NQ317_001778 [Molorchus minor]